LRAGRVRRWSVLAAACIVFALLLARMDWWESALRTIFGGTIQAVYPRGDLLLLVGQHLELVAISSALTLVIGIPLGVWVTRRSGREFLPLVSDITSFGQTFPPVAVLALAVPLLGFGLWPTVVALFLYGLLPVVRSTIAGLESVPSGVLVAARGLGMSNWRVLLHVEIPLAGEIMMGGVRTSVVINIGTAMVGAVVGAGGLGSPIIAGLVEDNLAYIVEGAVPAAVLAVLADQLLANVEGTFAYSAARA